MNNPTSALGGDPEFRAIEQQAAEWFGRCEVGLTPAQEREFLRWLEADARHGEALREMDETWDFLDRLKESKRLRAATPAVSHRKRSVRLAPVLLAAAAIAVMLGVWQARKETPLVRHAATEVGGMKKIELPDGSVVHLNGSSSVDVRFTRAVRRVQLQRGEAHFKVAKDTARPFVVVVADVAVKAVGTEFNVRREARAIEVFVTEGKVRLDDAVKGESLLTRPEPTRTEEPAPVVVAAADLLVAGQRALVPLATIAAATPPRAVVAPIAPAEIERALAWQARQLDFDQKPLGEVVAAFNRYNSRQLVIADAELAQQPFGGSFRADNGDVFVELLEQRFGVTAERNGETTVLRRAK
jgi:transmembrane sensor